MTQKQINKYILFDFLAAIIVWVLFYLFRRVVNDFATLGSEDMSYFVPSYRLWYSALFYPITSLFIHYLTGFYNETASKSRIVEFFTSFVSSFFIAIITFFVLLLDDDVLSYTFYYKSFFVLLTLQFLITYLFRIFITLSIFRQFKTGKSIIPLLIIGTGENAAEITKNISLSKHFVGNKLVGYISINSHTIVDETMVLGDVDSLEDIVKRYDVKEVIIAVDGMDDKVIFSLVNRLLHFGINIMFAPRLYEIITGNVMLGDIHSGPLVSIARSKMPPWQQSVKRIFDMVSSALLLILLSPLCLYLMLRIKFDSKGSVFYTQERLGYKGEIFNIIKFRTMVHDAEVHGPQLSIVNDSRITCFGAFMRKYRFDELPQLWNIIRGDMSVVGPRPERRFYIDQIEKKAPYYCLLYSIRPGLLSWGPIKIGYADSVDKMVDRLKYDIVYMNNMTLITDVKIMFYSVEVIVNGKGQ